ncbi:MAG TPA: hypothetical protein VFZ00_12200 [Solirubrobacter sp.]|jgi:hypothetical protein|nr:hypothetical protein [Solirubrobacter sp.]
MRLSGLPSQLVAGRTYTVALEPTGEERAIERAGATIGVFDRTGRGWSAKYDHVRGLSQQFAVGLRGAPYTISATYEEPTCTRTLSVSLPVERRIYAIVGCARRALEPRRLVLRCGGRRLRVTGLRWTGWNRDTAVGRGRGVTVTLSSPRECATLDGFIYTRARVVTRERTYRRIPIACPL